MIDRNKLRVVLAFSRKAEPSTKQVKTEMLRRLSDTHALESGTDILQPSQEKPGEGGQREALLDSNAKVLVEEQIDSLLKAGINLVTIADAEYPLQLRRVLGDRAPPFLFWKGNKHLFEGPAIGFCGSRHASERGLEVCADIVEQLTERNTTIVAGYAAGVDQLAHRTALKLGGRTIAVLPEGIFNFNIRQLLADDWDWNRTLVVSEYLPNARWTVGRAMQRNRTIIGLTKGLVVIEAKETGGTFEAGKAALSLGHPLFAPTYNSASGIAYGNRHLIARGAQEILKSRTLGRANIRSLLEILNDASGSKSQSTLKLG